MHQLIMSRSRATRPTAPGIWDRFQDAYWNRPDGTCHRRRHWCRRAPCHHENAFAFRNEAIGRFFPDPLVTLGKGAVGLELTPGGSASARLLAGRRFGRCDNPFGIGMFAPPFLHERVGDLLALLARQLIAWFDVFDLDRSFAVAESDNQITVWEGCS